MPATTPANIDRINEMFNKIANLLTILSIRWQAEKEYEDITEYQVAIQEFLPEGFTITKMIKRSFGFQFNIGTEAVYEMNASTKSVSWKRIK